MLMEKLLKENFLCSFGSEEHKDRNSLSHGNLRQIECKSSSSMVLAQREQEEEELLDIRKAKRETGSSSGSKQQIAFVWSKSIQCKNVYLFQSLPPRGLSSVALHLLA
jgi:hypothetical protein